MSDTTSTTQIDVQTALAAALTALQAVAVAFASEDQEEATTAEPQVEATVTSIEKAPSKRKGARKTTNRKATGSTIEGKTCLVKGNRAKFAADHEWVTDSTTPTHVLLRAVVEGGQPLTGNWAIGPRNVERFGGPVGKALVAGARGKNKQVAVKA